MSAFKRSDNVRKIKGELHIEVFKKGVLIDEQIIHNLVTDLGFEHFADQLSATPSQSPISAMAVGTGTGQTSSDTTLDTEIGRQPLTGRTKGTGADNTKVIYTASFEEGVATGTLTEAGLFNALTSGVMVCYSEFETPVVKASDTVVNITWSVNFA